MTNSVFEVVEVEVGFTPVDMAHCSGCHGCGGCAR